MNKDKVLFEILSEQIKAVGKQTESVQYNLDIHIKDTDIEVERLQKIAIDVATLTETVNELRKTLDRHVERVSNRVDQAIEPMLEESNKLKKSTNALKESIDKKKFVRIWIIKSFWDKFKFWKPKS